MMGAMRRTRSTFIAWVLSIVMACSSAIALSPAQAALGPDPQAADIPGGMLVHLRPGVPWQLGLDVVRAAGARVATRYPMIGVLVAYGRPEAFEIVGDSAFIEQLEPNAALTYMTDTSHQATRGAQLLSGTTYKKFSSKPVDGSDIGVAIVDTGIDGTHPDLRSRMVSNVRIVCTNPGTVFAPVRECAGAKTAVPLDDTDGPGASGHGTHVAGIVAGTGEASQGTYSGAAPGASLYGVGMGTFTFVENALDGLRWVYDNHDKVSPSIRVVNNSWGGPHQSPDDPSVSAVTKLVNLLVKEGITVVFSAGNAGGKGATPATSATCVNPTPGVICVANFDDRNTGNRDGTLDTTSSRGASRDPRTWPDISAPGTSIVSTCRVHLVLCTVFGSTTTSPYGTLSGTSMSAPHVTGIAAQLLQINPRLTPANIEDILEDSAYQFENGVPYVSDPANRGEKSSFDKGHGLVDAVAAARAAFRRYR